MTPASLRRTQWAVRATLSLGVAASVTANILHAQPNPIAQAIAAWPPLALLITAELVSRIPIHRPSLGAVRITATAAIAGIAGWVSYWHLVGVVVIRGLRTSWRADLVFHVVDMSVTGPGRVARPTAGVGLTGGEERSRCPRR